MTQVTVRQAHAPADIDTVRGLCWGYRAYLLSFSSEVTSIIERLYPHDAYAALMDGLAVKHARPEGFIVIAEQDGAPIGCGMSHALTPTDAEIKRVFVQDRARGSGAGRRISQALIDQARADGFKRILLDTSAEFTGAQRLYASLGFVRRGPYSDMPPDIVASLVFFELTL